MAKPVLEEFGSPGEVVVTPAKDGEVAKDAVSPPLMYESSDHSVSQSNSSASSPQQQQEKWDPCMQDLLLDGFIPDWNQLECPNPDEIRSSMTSTGSPAKLPQHQTVARQIPQRTSYFSPMSSIEYKAPLVDHSESNKTKAQKKQEKKERKKELKRERQEVQQLITLERQEREMDEKLVATESSGLWTTASNMVDTLLSVTEPFVTPYAASDDYLEDDIEEYSGDSADEYDEEEDFDDDFLMFEDLDAVKMKKSKRKKSFGQNSSPTKKKKKKKKNKPKRRGRRVDYEETEDGKETSADDSLLTPSKKNIAERVEAIFTNKQMILKDFDEYIDKTAAETKVDEPEQRGKNTASGGRRPRSHSNNGDKRGRSKSNSKSTLPKLRTIRSLSVNPTSQNKRPKEEVLLAQSFENNIEVMLANSSRSLLSKKSTLQSNTGSGRSKSPKQKKPIRRSQSSGPSNGPRKDKGYTVMDQSDVIEIILGGVDKKKRNSRKNTAATIDPIETQETRHAEPEGPYRKMVSSKNESVAVDGVEKNSKKRGSSISPARERNSGNGNGSSKAVSSANRKPSSRKQSSSGGHLLVQSQGSRARPRRRNSISGDGSSVHSEYNDSGDDMSLGGWFGEFVGAAHKKENNHLILSSGRRRNYRKKSLSSSALLGTKKRSNLSGPKVPHRKTQSSRSLKKADRSRSSSRSRMAEDGELSTRKEPPSSKECMMGELGDGGTKKKTTKKVRRLSVDDDSDLGIDGDSDDVKRRTFRRERLKAVHSYDMKEMKRKNSSKSRLLRTSSVREIDPCDPPSSQDSSLDSLSREIIKDEEVKKKSKSPRKESKSRGVPSSNHEDLDYFACLNIDDADKKKRNRAYRRSRSLEEGPAIDLEGVPPSLMDLSLGSSPRKGKRGKKTSS